MSGTVTCPQGGEQQPTGLKNCPIHGCSLPQPPPSKESKQGKINKAMTTGPDITKIIVAVAIVVIVTVGGLLVWIKLRPALPSDPNSRTEKPSVTEKLTTPPDPWWKQVSIQQGSSLDIEKGTDMILGAAVSPDDGTEYSFVWASDNPSIVSVDPDSGKISAKEKGTAKITATAADIKEPGECAVTVFIVVPVQSVSISQGSSISIDRGSGKTLNADVTPNDATNNTIFWTSSDPSIASVDRDTGLVTAKSKGTATITATADGKSASCTITVAIPVGSIAITQGGSLTIEYNQEMTLGATVIPNDASSKTVTWNSSNSAIVSVGRDSGKITGKAQGTATITATAGSKSAKCTVTVKPPIPVDSVSIGQGRSLTIARGNSQSLSATVTPSNAASRTVVWSSSSPSVVSVDSSSGRITANTKGSATITATAGGKSSTCTVTVNVPVTGVRVSQNYMSLSQGNTDYFYVTIIPSDADNKNFEAYGQPASIAGVLSKDVSSGKVTVRGNQSGTTKIVVKTKDGDFTAECEVRVY